jgi:hypothetical protein
MTSRLTHARSRPNLREVAATLAVFAASMLVVGSLLHVLWLIARH